MRDAIEGIVRKALYAAIDSGLLADSEQARSMDLSIERPRDESFGDWASSVAMKSAKLFSLPPRQIADALLPAIDSDERVASAEVAGPGFINIRMSDGFLQGIFQRVREQGRAYGHCDMGRGRKVQVEFVSANPTGPMHVGHGRWAALGDSIASVLEACGWDVEREFLINDAGRQMDIFAHSVSVRYMQICRLVAQGHSAVQASEELVSDTALEERDRKYSEELGGEAYGGAYVVDIAYEIYCSEGGAWADRGEAERSAYFKERAYGQVLTHVKDVLERVGVRFDVWFSERTLHERGQDGKCAIDHAIDLLDDKGYIYKEGGAIWFRSTAFDDDKDRVLVKADGSYTYFAADVAYHLDKYRRGFDSVIDLWGADITVTLRV